jgi:hypothetical protein
MAQRQRLERQQQYHAGLLAGLLAPGE